ncbi:hypothetical protein EDD21DRAFT_425076 [Dissophora ornata]|nr:hypothetical protein EDD21DRAFT_425076 [Dissophora ornata]
MRNRKIQKTYHRPFLLQRFLLDNHDLRFHDTSPLESRGTELPTTDEKLAPELKQDTFSPGEKDDSTGKCSTEFISDQHRLSPATSFSRLHTNVSSISPLPIDVFRHLLQFLNAGDLWKLCRVSREMANDVSMCMWASQRFEFEVVRILHRQNHYTTYDWHRLSFVMQHEEMLGRFWVNNASRLIVSRPRQPLPPPGMLPLAVLPSSSDSSLSPAPTVLSDPSSSPGFPSDQSSFGSQAAPSLPGHMLSTDWNPVFSPTSPGNTIDTPSGVPIAPDYLPGSPNYTTTSPSYSPHSTYSSYSPSSSPSYSSHSTYSSYSPSSSPLHLFSSPSSPSYSPPLTNESSPYPPDAPPNASAPFTPTPSPVSSSEPSSSSESLSDPSSISRSTSNSVAHSGEGIKRGVIRNRYWRAQADQILSALVAGTQYATVPSNWRELLAMERAATVAARTTEVANEDAEAGGGENATDGDVEGGPAASPIGSPAAATNATSIPSVELDSLPRALLMELLRKSTQGQEPPPLPMQRFWSMVDVLFDPNVVGLNHRRAMVNCARYVTSSIESGFGMIVSMQNPSDPYTHSIIMRDCSVSIEPYLKVFLPCNEGLGGISSEQSPNQQALQAHTRVYPPQKLVSYIQAMLWHRCLSDLVKLYSRIQGQHARPVVIRSEHIGVLNECGRPSNQRSRSHQISANLGSAYDTGAAEDPPQKQSMHTKNDQGSDGEYVQRLAQWSQRGLEIRPTDFALRRHRLEDRISQDNLVKQELLSVCQMACGLFTLRIPLGSSRPKTVMTLLRQGSPWLKGVWREGEWRQAPVDVDNDEDEVVMSRRLDLEQEYQLEEGLLRNSGSATASEIRDRLDELYNLSLMEEFYGREGEDDTRDQGPWQRLCIATIQFLVEKNLDWGGNESDDELCKLRATVQPSGWYYHE